MKFLSKIIANVFFVLITGQNFIASAAEAPPKAITQANRVMLKKFIEAELKNDFDFYKTRSSFALESVIPVVKEFLVNNSEFETLRKDLKLNKDDLKGLLTNVAKNAQKRY